MLDRLKQKEATKRVLFLHSQKFQYSKNMTVSNGKGLACEEQNVYLRVRRGRLPHGCRTGPLCDVIVTVFVTFSICTG